MRTDYQKVRSSNPGFANIFFIKQFLSNFLGYFCLFSKQLKPRIFNRLLNHIYIQSMFITYDCPQTQILLTLQPWLLRQWSKRLLLYELNKWSLSSFYSFSIHKGREKARKVPNNRLKIVSKTSFLFKMLTILFISNGQNINVPSHI